MKNRIPTRKENPKGLHQRYHIQKISEFGNVIPIDREAEYFVMRLDEGGSDINHIRACRIGIHAYADAIEPFIPDLALDLRERYPLL
jgi:hypothetical protein